MAKQRLSQLDAQLNELKKEQAELTKQWEREREEMQRLQVNIHAFFQGRSTACSLQTAFLLWLLCAPGQLHLDSASAADILVL